MNDYDTNKNSYFELEKYELFNEVFQLILDCVYEFNNKYALTDNNFIIIKGGASVEHHLHNKNQLLTNDIDLTFVSKNDKYILMLHNFYLLLKNKLTNYSFVINEYNGLYNIYINNIRIIDITFYDKKRNI